MTFLKSKIKKKPLSGINEDWQSVSAESMRGEHGWVEVGSGSTSKPSTMRSTTQSALLSGLEVRVPSAPGKPLSDSDDISEVSSDENNEVSSDENNEVSSDENNNYSTQEAYGTSQAPSHTKSTQLLPHDFSVTLESFDELSDNDKKMLLSRHSDLDEVAFLKGNTVEYDQDSISPESEQDENLGQLIIPAQHEMDTTLADDDVAFVQDDDIDSNHVNDEPLKDPKDASTPQRADDPHSDLDLSSIQSESGEEFDTRNTHSTQEGGLETTHEGGLENGLQPRLGMGPFGPNKYMALGAVAGASAIALMRTNRA
ncbi:MAG: hypothetical protein SGCHY_002289 [Lobulomycetales sp.]